MNKKLWIIFSLIGITIVTYQVTADKTHPEIVSAKEKLLTNLAHEKEEIKQHAPKAPVKQHVPMNTETRSVDPPADSFRGLLPDEDKVEPKQTDKSAVTVKEKAPRKRRRIFPPKDVLAKTGSGSEKDGDASSAIRGGGAGGGSTVISGSPRVFVVTETGEGEAYLLMEAIRLLNPGDKIELKKGTYSLLIGHLSVPDFEIAGEGEGTLLELQETLKLQQQNLTFRDLKLANTSSGAAIDIRNNKKLTLQNVQIQGNGNDCLEVNQGQVFANDFEVQRCNRAIYLKANSSVQISGISISDSDYGIFVEGENPQTITNLKAENLNLFSVFFTSGSAGNLTCISCTLTDNSTNRKNKLILKSAP